MQRTSHLVLAVLATLLLATIPASGQRSGLEVDEPFPALELPTIDRERTIRISDLRGKAVLLIQFASW